MSPSTFTYFSPHFKRQYGEPYVISVADLYVECILVDLMSFKHYPSCRYLIRTLNLLPSNSARPSISLHDVENALSVLDAAMFWVCKWWLHAFTHWDLIQTASGSQSFEFSEHFWCFAHKCDGPFSWSTSKASSSTAWGNHCD